APTSRPAAGVRGAALLPNSARQFLMRHYQLLGVESSYGNTRGVPTADVLAFDPELKRLYVASESGTESVFEERGQELVSLGSVHASHAHSVAVDPRTHHVFLPLENVGGRPVLRIMEPGSQ
ncbi:MAG: hypothetical protein ACR2M1_14650, partial [Gemmatimonadaceae bacterium]